ncbi:MULTISPECIES: hypothetical protein [Streptomyces]|uniref:hypothetical protein n=1 Tax=Streptomyces TaxID=1883 RepID=UPI0013171B02|nr:MULTISPECIES: hypothetical protein [Streptomyces]QGZ52141.1 hypothetical protein GPZ77_30640 [Streptomyces sp. QHH-9511]GGT73636.1 hypothetical protein GCM10010272_16250 [Streptomyces lateritius]
MDLAEENDGPAPGPAPGSRRQAARRTVASRVVDRAELAELLDILDLRPEVDHLYPGTASETKNRRGPRRPE